MVLLNDIIQVGRWPTTTMPSEFAGLLQFGNGGGYAGWPSTLMTRGGGAPPNSAKRRNSFAAIRSRLGDSMNSIVSPDESTARYRYAQAPATLIYVSSTRQDRLGCRSFTGEFADSKRSRTAVPRSGRKLDLADLMKDRGAAVQGAAIMFISL